MKKEQQQTEETNKNLTKSTNQPIVVFGMIGLLLSSWRRFFISGMMILEYSLVMAEGCQRQNWTVYYIICW